MSLEIISMVASSVVGFLFKMVAQHSADRAEQHRLMLERHVNSEESIAAARSYNGTQSNWVRRFLVISFMSMAFVTLLAPLFGLPTVVAVEEATVSIFGLFTFGGGTVLQTVEGMIAPLWLGQAVMSLVGFYFGQSVASRKHL